ncbi:MAG: T9SS type A sorting domain-containing protein, partial [Candidatus Eisenbacteria bacterium]|nr:T9SS type A sorting domain-containing protein [Candidatus Eisenbacteria bacterium]
SNTSGTVAIEDSDLHATATSGHVGVHLDSNAGLLTLKRVNVYGEGSSNMKGVLIESDALMKGVMVRDFDGTLGAGFYFDLADSNDVPEVTTDVSGSTTYSRVYDCYNGMSFQSHSRPKVRSTRVDSTSNAFDVGITAAPNLGLSGDAGNNDVSNATLKFVKAKSRLAGYPSIDAVKNYWGTTNTTTIAAKMTSHAVWQPILTTDPISSLSRPGLEIEQTTTRAFTRAPYPNPFSGSVHIEFGVPNTRETVDIRVFDISGRLIQEYAPRGVSGIQRWTWDGTDMDGRDVAAGVYYYRVTIGSDLQETHKVVLVK